MAPENETNIGNTTETNNRWEAGATTSNANATTSTQSTHSATLDSANTDEAPQPLPALPPAPPPQRSQSPLPTVVTRGAIRNSSPTPDATVYVTTDIVSVPDQSSRSSAIIPTSDPPIPSLLVDATTTAVTLVTETIITNTNESLEKVDGVLVQPATTGTIDDSAPPTDKTNVNDPSDAVPDEATVHTKEQEKPSTSPEYVEITSCTKVDVTVSTLSADNMDVETIDSIPTDTIATTEKKNDDKKDTATNPIVTSNKGASLVKMDVTISVNSKITEADSSMISPNTKAVDSEIVTPSVNNPNTTATTNSDNGTILIKNDDKRKTEPNGRIDDNDIAAIGVATVAEGPVLVNGIDATATTKTSLPIDDYDDNMEVDDLVCQEDESAFDYPIPIHTTNRSPDPSMIHGSAKTEPNYNPTSSITSKLHDPVAPASTAKFSIETTSTKTSELMVMEKVEVVECTTSDSLRIKNAPCTGSVTNPTNSDVKSSISTIEIIPVATIGSDRSGTLSNVVKNDDASGQFGVNSDPLRDSSWTNTSSDLMAKRDPNIPHNPLSEINTAEDRTTHKRVLDDDRMSSRKKIRALPRPSHHTEAIHVKRPNLTKIKHLLYTAGKLVHSKSVMNYDKLFGDYWGAFARRLEGPMNAYDMTKNQNALQSFLKSATLRKLHNQLILGVYHVFFSLV